MRFWLASLLALPLAIGLVSAAFHAGLEFGSRFFESDPRWVAALPLLALLTVLLQRRFQWASSTAMLVRDLETATPLYKRAAVPFILVFSSLSQLFGASTGREGAAVQMGAALSEFVPGDRRRFVRALGIASGFGGVFGLPWAGALFAWECRRDGRRLRELPFFAGAAWIAFVVSSQLHEWPARKQVDLAGSIEPRSWLAWVAIGLALALVARVYLRAHREITVHFARLPFWLPPFLGGGAVAALTWLLGSTRYNGLGVNLIALAEMGSTGWGDLWMKMVFTLLSLGAGLWGGEVTPILSMGAVTGAGLAAAAGLPAAPFASVAMPALFAACAAVPLTGIAMTVELFGAGALGPAVIVIAISHALTGSGRMFTKH